MPSSFALRAAGLLFLLAAAPLSAQAVRGTLVDQESGNPVPGALMVLLDHTGAERASTLTDAGGAFLLRASAPGTVRIRAERIGYASTISEPLEIRAGETRDYRMAAPVEVVALSGVSVTGARRCVLRPEEGLEVTRVWNEARKALNATALADDQRLLRYDVVLYERELDPRRLSIKAETRRTRSEFATHPFASRLTPEELSQGGYVQPIAGDTFYLAPDAPVLLSDVFLNDHCFRIQPGREEQKGLVGLAFEPVGDRKVPGIKGVLWVDENTAELRSLNYEYTDLRLLTRPDQIGGLIEFQRLPSGLWIVSRWRIRMPMVQIRKQEPVRLSGGIPSSYQESLVGIKETGGVVVEARDRRDSFFHADQAVLTGVVWDSTRAKPLQGATIYLSGTQHSTATNERGRYVLEGLPEGEYVVSYMHPRLDSLSVIPETRPVELRRGEAARVNLGVPAIAASSNGSRGAVRVIERETLGSQRAHLFGTVTDSDGKPLTAVRVSIADPQRSISADTRGEFRVRDLEPGTYRVGVRQMGYETKPFTISLGEGEIVRVAIALEPEPVKLAGVEATVEEPRRVPAALAGFYRRAERGFGHYITREKIEELNPNNVNDLLTTVPGVFLVTEGGRTRVRIGRAKPSLTEAYLKSLSAPGQLDSYTTGTPDRRAPTEAPEGPGMPKRPVPSAASHPDVLGGELGVDCIPLFFLDGVPFAVPYGDISYVVRPEEIEGIEVYTSAEIPAQFKRHANKPGEPSSECGVIVVWTRYAIN
jgi:hypothetical protein